MTTNLYYRPRLISILLNKLVLDNRKNQDYNIHEDNPRL